MHELHQHTNYIKSVLDNLIKQPFVEKHINKPFIDEDKLQLSYYLYRNHIDDWEALEKYMMSAALVQIAIDTHEKVHSKHEVPMVEIEKQLNVLIGDYYSGLYYYILSELEDIEMIDIVAQSIKAINEYKMNILYRDIQSIDDLLYTFAKVESVFFVNILKQFNELQYIPVIEQFLLINRLKHEKALMLNNQYSDFEQFILYSNTKQELVSPKQLIDAYLAEQIDKLYQTIQKNELSQDPFARYMTDRLDVTYKTIAVKEGL